MFYYDKILNNDGSFNLKLKQHCLSNLLQESFMEKFKNKIIYKDELENFLEQYEKI